MRRRLALTGLAVLASLTVATSACSTGQPGTGTTTPPAKAATDLLDEAGAKTKGQSFKYALTYGELVTGSGAQDSTGGNAQSNMTISVPGSGLTIKANVLVLGDDMYLKMDLGPLTASIPGLAGLGDKWMHVDGTKVGASGLAKSLTPGGDSMTAESFIKGVVSAERVSDTEIRGTIDLSKSAPAMVPAAELAKLGPESKNVPFTATLDGEGRITKIVIKMPKVGENPASDLTTTYSDYGSVVAVTKPAPADTVEAPEMIYQFLR